MRKLLVIVALSLGIAAPQTALAQADDVVVAVDGSAIPDATSGGVLSRSTEPTAVGLVAVCAALSVLGLTLAKITRHRLSTPRQGSVLSMAPNTGVGRVASSGRRQRPTPRAPARLGSPNGRLRSDIGLDARASRVSASGSQAQLRR